MTITDEMVEKALEKYISAYPAGAMLDYRRDMRAALEAVAPLLIAQGMYMATDMLTGDPHSFKERILGRAAAIALGQEFNPK